MTSAFISKPPAGGCRALFPRLEKAFAWFPAVVAGYIDCVQNRDWSVK